MGYYIYTNWKSKDNKVNKIHIGSCGHFNNGLGKHDDADCDKNGVWIGPFKKIEYARDYGVLKFEQNINECECIKNKY
jgi:hypothetical protein